MTEAATMWGDSPASPPAAMVNSVCSPPPLPASADTATHVSRPQTAASASRAAGSSKCDLICGPAASRLASATATGVL